MDLTIVVAIYGQPKMLDAQLCAFMSYPESLRRRLKFIIVDDHGNPEVTLDEVKNFNDLVRTELYRVDDNIAWNQMGARNLGMSRADGWCVMIDPDMVFETDVLERMLEAIQVKKRGRLIKYGLQHHGNHGRGINMTSPNTFVIHSDDFFQCGGYDEDFAGNKGWSDVQLQEVYKQHFKVEERPDLYAEFYSNADFEDAMVTSLDRDTAANRVKRLKKVGQQKACGGWRRWVAKHKGPNFRFQWTKLFPT